MLVTKGTVDIKRKDIDNNIIFTPTDYDMVHHLKDRWSVIIEDHVVQVAPAQYPTDDIKKRARWTGKFSGFSPETSIADIFDCMSLSVDGVHAYRTEHDKLNVYVEFTSEDKLNAAITRRMKKNLQKSAILFGAKSKAYLQISRPIFGYFCLFLPILVYLRICSKSPQ